MDFTFHKLDLVSYIHTYMQIVEILKGNGAALELLQRQKSRFQRTYSEELLDAEEYNSTKYLSDMDRHLEIVLGACDIDV